MRLLLWLLFFSAVSWSAPVFQSVEFPFAAFPRQYWDRELVWMKNVGIHNVALEVRSPAEEEDVMAILRTLRKLDLTAWVRLAPAAASLEKTLAPLRQSHGGAILYFSSQAPSPVIRLSALSTGSLAASRAAMSGGGGTLLWVDVEETLNPVYHRGAISFAGEESATVTALRRDALLMAYWAPSLPLFPTSRSLNIPSSHLPEALSAHQLLTKTGAGASAVSLTNAGKTLFHGELQVFYPPLKHNIAVPGVEVAAGESLWLPVNIPLTKGPFCRNCDALGNDDSIVYATAELTGAEYENGILALEFAAPLAGEVVVHLSKPPTGPLIAGGKPRPFDWDIGSGRARLPVPAGRAPGFRVRIALAMEPPDSSAFFEDSKVLIIGQSNIVPTNYSSEEIAARSRLRAPANLKFQAIPKGPLTIDYAVTVPPDALHGDHAELSLEADGVQMGHTRLQILRPASLRIREEVKRHFGIAAELPVFPSLIPMDQRAGRDISIVVRNNFPEIKTYVLALAGDGFDFSPARTEITVAASSERDVSVRVFPRENTTGLRPAKALLSGAAAFEAPMQFAVIPRGETITYNSGAGYVLESAKARAVFADESLQKWLEFTWKDSERNVLPESGIDFGTGRRTATLKDAELTFEQETPLPAEKLKPGKRSDLTLQVQRPSPNHAVYLLSR